MKQGALCVLYHIHLIVLSCTDVVVGVLLGVVEHVGVFIVDIGWQDVFILKIIMGMGSSGVLVLRVLVCVKVVVFDMWVHPHVVLIMSVV